MAQKLLHLRTTGTTAPSTDKLLKGMIAIQMAASDPALWIQDADGHLVKFIASGAIETAIEASKTNVEGQITSLSSSVETLSASTINIEASAHTHGNKAVLDGITAEKVTAWDNAAESAHTHANKAVLDALTAEEVAKWNESAHTHANKALLDTYTQTETDLADAVSKKHEHANASVLDGISAEDVQAWDGAVTALDNKVDKVEGKGLSTNDYTTAEKEKLASIAASADTNVIETVKVNGTALTVADKAVDILVAEGTANGTVKVNGVDVNVHGLGSAAYADTTAFDASGAAAAVKTELIGDMTGATKTLGGLEDRIDALATGSNVTISTTATTEGYLKSYTFSQNGAEIGVIDIPKDLVVTSGQIVEEGGVKYLRLTIANQDEPVNIAVSDLVDVYTQGNGIEISNSNEISAKVVAGNGLSLDANGIAMAAASSAGAGAMSSADFDKLASVAASAQVNTVEGVQVNGADLTPDANKKVNVTITSGTNNGTIAVNGSDVAVKGLKSAAYADSTDFDEAGAAAAASAAAVTSAKSYVDSVIADSVTGATGDTLVNASVSNKVVTVGATADLTAAVANANSALQTISKGTDGSYVTTTVGTKADSDQSIGVAVTVVDMTAATASNKGLAEASDVKSYVDGKTQDALTGATGDTLVSATAANNVVTVAATQDLQDAVALANSSVQGVSSATTLATAGVVVDSDKNLDFTDLTVDCGTY